MFWLWAGEDKGIWLLALVSLAIALCGLAYFLPLGPSAHVTGVVESLTLGNNKNGNYPLAHVQLDGQMVLIVVPPNSCEAGDVILLERQRRLWGYSVMPDPIA